MESNFFWVSGQYKSKKFSKKLLQQCLDDASAKGMDGVIAVSSDKKRPFMSDPKFFKRQGFEIVDEAPPFFKLLGLKTNPDAEYPRFKSTARAGKCPDNRGIMAYYSDTCPFNDYYINVELRKYAEDRGIPITINHLTSKEAAQQMPIPWILCSIFYKGELVTIEVKADKHLDKLIA